MEERLVHLPEAATRADPVRPRWMLQDCLKHSLLYLAVQPVVSAQSDRTVGYEGLLRSRHPSLASPKSILETAEVHDLLDPVAAAIALDAVRWLSELPKDTMLFLKVHPLELVDKWSLSERMAILQPWADRLAMEITDGPRLPYSDARQDVVRHLSRFAQSADAKLIAEGVETLREARAAAACGAHLAQGYFFGSPTAEVAA